LVGFSVDIFGGISAWFSKEYFDQTKTKNKKKKLTDIGFIGFSGLVPGFTGGSFSKDLDRLMLR
jgi:hypothetical protein